MCVMTHAPQASWPLFTIPIMLHSHYALCLLSHIYINCLLLVFPQAQYGSMLIIPYVHNSPVCLHPLCPMSNHHLPKRHLDNDHCPMLQYNCLTGSPVALQLRPPPKVSARAPAHRSYHFRGVKLKSCIKKIHHNLYISKQANVRIKHADTEGASHKKFGTDARVQ